MTYELHSDIINQSLNIQALSIALCRGHVCTRACARAYVRACVSACARECVRTCVRPTRRIRLVVFVRPRIRYHPSLIVHAECKRVYALRQVCVRVNYVLGRRIYRHPVNLHRPRGLYVTVRSSVPIHPSTDVRTLHVHGDIAEPLPRQQEIKPRDDLQSR